jgi:hypothetical protein
MEVNMSNSEILYNFLKEHPAASNPEIAEGLNWDSTNVRRYKYRLKKRGFIVFDNEGVIILKPFNQEVENNEIAGLKQDAYKELFDACVDRMHGENTSTPQFIELVREVRMILKEMV